MSPAMSRFLIVSAALLLAAACQKEGSADTKAMDELTERIKKLEAENEKNKEAMAFLNEAYEGQRRQREEQEAQEPAQDAVFAVDISQDVDQIDGPPDALVTIVEAWDFA